MRSSEKNVNVKRESECEFQNEREFQKEKNERNEMKIVYLVRSNLHQFIDNIPFPLSQSEKFHNFFQQQFFSTTRNPITNHLRFFKQTT